MTREEVFAAMTTMQCWLNSERIQVSGPCGFWVDVADNEFPSWDWSNYRWRVKPHTDVPHGCDCCDPTHDSPDPVVVRLERENDELQARLAAAEAERDVARRCARHFHKDAVSHGMLGSDAAWETACPWLTDEAAQAGGV